MSCKILDPVSLIQYVGIYCYRFSCLDTQPPDVTHNTAQGGRRNAAADRLNRYASSASDDTMGTGTGRWKVSAKIQQLLNTLKRPKRRPLPEFYEDDDIELEIAANPKDPNAPKPEGSFMILVKNVV